MENKICVYAICKNESKFVEQWYKSMSEADSIVVLDTGSTDDTVEKLKKLGVKVEQKIIEPWGFGDARNESMKLIPDDCNILVCTDLDEYFEEGWAKPLREKWVEGVHNRCVYTYYIRPDHFIYYDKIHGRNYYWKYPIHEMLCCDKSVGLTTLYLQNEIVLHHDRDASKSRESYLRLLERRVKENENDFIGIIYLVGEYQAVGRHEDVLSLLETVDLDKCDNDLYRLSIAKIKAETLLHFGRTKDCIGWINYCMRINKSYRELYYLLAKCFEENNDLMYYTLLKGIENSTYHQDWFEKEYLWKGGMYYDLLSLTAYYSGHIAESLIYAGMALKIEPNNDRYKQNINSIINNLSEEEIIKYRQNIKDGK